MMINPYHRDILKQIKRQAGKPAKDAFLNGYMGNDHVRYAMSMPTLRIIAKDWSRNHKDLPPPEFAAVLTSLIEAKSSTEKILAGILMGYAPPAQRKFNPAIFDAWLDHLVGWAEIDAVCTGDFSITQLPADWPKWKKLLRKLAKDPNINKRRASLVLLCSPLNRTKDDRLAEMAFQNISRLTSEKDVIITKAISWVLRSMVKHYRDLIADYLEENKDTLPKIAIRETKVKLVTGKKNTRKSEM